MAKFYSRDGRVINEGTIRRAVKFYGFLYRAKHGRGVELPRPARRLLKDLETPVYEGGLQISQIVE